MDQDITIAVANTNPFALVIQNGEGDTPLHTAFRYCASDELLKFLIDLVYNHVDSCLANNYESHDDDKESTCFGMTNIDGDTPLHAAVSHEGSPTIVKTLLDVYPQGILCMNNHGQTPLHVAAELQRFDLIQTLLKNHACLECIDMLLEVEDSDGNSPLSILWDHYICTQGRSETYDSDSQVVATASADILKACRHCFKECWVLDGQQDYTKYEAHGNTDNENKMYNNYKTKSNHEMIDTSASTHYTTQHAYDLLQASIFLGDNVVPGDFVSYLVKNHPSILHMQDAEGRLPLHTIVLEASKREGESDEFSCVTNTTTPQDVLITNEVYYDFQDTNVDGYEDEIMRPPSPTSVTPFTSTSAPESILEIS